VSSVGDVSDSLVTRNSTVPDGYFELETGSEIRPMFVEVDLGNEALRIWRKKMQAYLQLAVSGEFARLFQQSRFRVLVLMHLNGD